MFIYFIDNHELLLYLRAIYSACARPNGRVVYGRSPTAIVVSNTIGGMDVCLLCVLYVVK
jgi:hypothetical protein